jgi:HD-GYP domain-containing protein (c-di-GMP phosphodiesterase class II)
MKSSIRLKTALMLMPALVASLTITASASLYTARSGMMRLAMRSLAFKAETLKQYGDAQWKLLETQGFSEDPDFLQAARASIESQAKVLLREDSEWFFALTLDGSLAMTATRSGSHPAPPPDLVAAMRMGRTGAVSFGQGREARIGEAFFFEPFGWYVVASDRTQSAFAETDRLTSILVWTFVASVVVALALLLLLARTIARPISCLSGAMTEILRTNDFHQGLEVASRDEIGVLTMQFNALCLQLDKSYSRIADIAEKEAKATFELYERELETLVALGRVAEFRDEDTGYHIVRSGLYARLLAGDFYSTEEERRVVYCAAPLHDIGKIGIPDHILLKPASLDPEEFEVIKTHAAIGHSILSEFNSPSLAMGAIVAWTHHERFDGSGYPRGLKAEEIPLCGRILAVIDVFDALCSKRPYKEAWAVDRAFEYLREERRRHFDPRIVDSFLDHRSQVEEIMRKYC